MHFLPHSFLTRRSSELREPAGGLGNHRQAHARARDRRSEIESVGIVVRRDDGAQVAAVLDRGDRSDIGEDSRKHSGLPGALVDLEPVAAKLARSEEHTSELQSLMRISYAVFCLKKKNTKYYNTKK